MGRYSSRLKPCAEATHLAKASARELGDVPYLPEAQVESLLQQARSSVAVGKRCINSSTQPLQTFRLLTERKTPRFFEIRHVPICPPFRVNLPFPPPFGENADRREAPPWL
ncbi:MAG TPA: hypothetical protein VE988_27110 [Gemmataceae bacterium]|nr:hypothetical protein [Gemmataceae bacterium]